MKSQQNILVAFLLNLFFSLFELVGGIFTSSIAIISDSIHDLGDSLSIGIAYLLEKRSKKQPDEVYTYGYGRYSIIGSLIITLILILGSGIVIYNSIVRMFNPIAINYDGMLVVGVVGVIVNFIAAYVTRNNHSLNQKTVSLHMLEDVLGWIVVLVGAIVMKFTNFVIIDSILSIGVAIFILFHAISHLKEAIDLFLEKSPKNIDVNHIREHLLENPEIIDVHHIHIWSMDGEHNYATMHVVSKEYSVSLKHEIKEELKAHNIEHATIEFENEDEVCDCLNCHVEEHHHTHHHHHH